MHLEGLFPRQDSPCIKCPDPPLCACADNELCERINGDCFTCPVNKCTPKPSDVKDVKGGVSKGALAGGIIGALLFLALAVGLFLWYRRVSQQRRLNEATDVKDTPAPAETVLNRPDPIEKPPPPAYSASSFHGLDPVFEGDRTESSPSLGHHYVYAGHSSNPFEDDNSIQTAGSEGTNVIPIALVPAGSHQPSLRSTTETQLSDGPVRPPRSPDVNLGPDHISGDGLRVGNHTYPPSMVSGISSHRHSYMSNMTSASEMLNEAPMIMTPTKGPVRQVLGVVKAEVISTGQLHNSTSSDSLRPPPFSRPPATSPLAATSFGPNDVVPEVDEPRENNPFDDKHSSTNANFSLSPPATASTFNPSLAPNGGLPDSNWASYAPNLPWSQGAQDDGLSRPSSMATQAGSIIDISSATRVNVGLATASTMRSHRTTMGRLVTPSSAGGTGTLEEQQARALAHAQAQAQAQGFDKPRPVSTSSALSATADSILESFPFVPPSPISNRPIRSPPVSPLAQQSFTAGSTSPLAQHTFNVAPPSPRTPNTFTESSRGSAAGSADRQTDSPLPPPPNRRTLGLSMASQFSTASSGLGSFPFQIDNGTDHQQDPPPPSYPGRQRASLDTLALTSDLSSYPLGFDRDSIPVPKRNGR